MTEQGSVNRAVFPHADATWPCLSWAEVLDLHDTYLDAIEQVAAGTSVHVPPAPRVCAAGDPPTELLTRVAVVSDRYSRLTGELARRLGGTARAGVAYTRGSSTPTGRVDLTL